MLYIYRGWIEITETPLKMVISMKNKKNFNEGTFGLQKRQSFLECCYIRPDLCVMEYWSNIREEKSLVLSEMNLEEIYFVSIKPMRAQ